MGKAYFYLKIGKIVSIVFWDASNLSGVIEVFNGLHHVME